MSNLTDQMLKNAQGLFDESIDADFAHLVAGVRDRIIQIYQGRVPEDKQDYLALLAMSDSPERNLLIVQGHRSEAFKAAVLELRNFSLCVELVITLGEDPASYARVASVKIKAVCDVR